MSEEKTYRFLITNPPDPEWKCYLFGNKPSGHGIVYIPVQGQVPNWFVRWMMQVCLGCTWVGLTNGDWNSTPYDTEFRAGAEWAEAKLKEKNT